MRLWDWLAGKVGDIWIDAHVMSLLPVPFWPAVLMGQKESLMLWSDYRAFTRLLRPGDFLIMTAKAFKGSNAAIPGAFRHLAVYVGAVKGDQAVEGKHFINGATWLGAKPPTSLSPDIHERCIVHAISEGVVCQDLGESIMEEDYVLAVRAWRSESEREIIVSNAFNQLGKGYDFDFSQSDDSRLFCTELGVHCCRKAAIILPDTVKKRLSLFGPAQDITIADHFTRYAPVCCSRSCLDASFRSQSIAREQLAHAVTSAWAVRSSQRGFEGAA